MSKSFILLLVLLGGCQELFYPADEHLELLNGEEMRLFCTTECPDQTLILEQMASLSQTCLRDFPQATYPQWAKYALTWSDIEVWNGETQVLGMTLHNRKAIYIYYPSARVARVVKWELLMASLEAVMPNVGEKAKIDWQLEFCPDF